MPCLESQVCLSAHPENSEIYNLILHVFFPQQALNRLHAQIFGYNLLEKGSGANASFLPPAQYKPWLRRTERHRVGEWMN